MSGRGAGGGLTFGRRRGIVDDVCARAHIDPRIDVREDEDDAVGGRRGRRAFPCARRWGKIGAGELLPDVDVRVDVRASADIVDDAAAPAKGETCLLYTSPSPRDS